MVPLASFMCMAQTSFFAQNFAQDSAGYTLMVLCTLLAFPAGFLLLARSEYPEATFWIACALVVVFPYDSLIALMAMTSLLARRSNPVAWFFACFFLIPAYIVVFRKLKQEKARPHANL